MEFDKVLVIFFFFFSTISLSVESRLFDYWKEPHFRLFSQISLPPYHTPPPPPPPPSTSGGGGGRIPDSPTVYNVLSYGAVGDGVADDTEAFKMGWDAACIADNYATFFVPHPYSFMIHSTIFTGPCKSCIFFKIEGIIMPPDGPGSWPKNNSKRQWLVFYRINGMLMEGDGLIDGKGDKWWNLPCKHHKGANGIKRTGPCDSPVAMRFFMSSNLTVKGLKIKNSPQFHFRFDNCSNVHIESLSIKAPPLSPNTDGIHIENSNDVRIYNSVVSNGDDCISIGAGCFNVDIRNMTCGPSHGISIGSLGSRNSRACVTNITVKDSIIKNSDNGVRIKTWQGGFGGVSKVTFKNINMDNVRNPIIIDQYYCNTKSCLNKTSAVYISGISYVNIKGTYDVRSPPIHLACSDSFPCTNVTFEEVQLFPSQGHNILKPFCWNAYGDMKPITIPPLLCLLKGFPDSSPTDDFGRC